MSDGAFSAALAMILTLDPEFLGIVGLSLQVSLTAVVIAAIIGMPAGAMLAMNRFPGRAAVIVVVNALMGLPPVIAGLAVYLMLSRSGPLGSLGFLFTPTAMIVAQTILVLPIVIALTRQVIEDLWLEYRDHLTSLGQTGRADCAIEAGTVVVGGLFRGEILASEKVVLLASSIVMGSIAAPRLVVESGVLLNARFRITGTHDGLADERLPVRRKELLLESVRRREQSAAVTGGAAAYAATSASEHAPVRTDEDRGPSEDDAGATTSSVRVANGEAAWNG